MMKTCPTCGSPIVEPAINPNYPRYIKHDGRSVIAHSVLHHSQMVGYPVKDDGSGERAVPPATAEDALAALYPDGESTQNEAPAAIDLKQLVSAGKWTKPSKNGVT